MNLLKKACRPFVYPIAFPCHEALLKSVADKFNQEEEVSFFTQDVALGLDDFEQFLVAGPMKQRGYVLDVGCGAGREAIALARLGYRVKAIDISHGMVEAGRDAACKSGLSIDFSVSSALDVQSSEEFDYCIFSSGIYNNIPSQELRLDVIRRIMGALKPHGSLFLPIGIRRRRSWYSRENLIDFFRMIIKLILPDKFRTETGDTLFDGEFFHYFAGFPQIEKELKRSDFSVRNLKRGLWQLYKQVDAEMFPLNAGRNMILLEKAKDIVREFQKKGIDCLILKGLYLAFHVYPDPGLRTMADIDFLIGKKDLAKTIELLEQLGYRRIVRPAQKETECDTTFCSDDKVYIDVHWDLRQYERFKGIIEITQDFWKRAIHYSENELTFKTLSLEDQILYVALHYSCFDFLNDIKGACDLFYLTSDGSVNWHVLLQRAQRYGITTPLYYSLKKAQDLTFMELPDFMLPALSPSRVRKRLLNYLLGHKTLCSYLYQALSVGSVLDAAKICFRLFLRAQQLYIGRIRANSNNMTGRSRY